MPGPKFGHTQVEQPQTQTYDGRWRNLQDHYEIMNSSQNFGGDQDIIDDVSENFEVEEVHEEQFDPSDSPHKYSRNSQEKKLESRHSSEGKEHIVEVIEIAEPTESKTADQQADTYH